MWFAADSQPRRGKLPDFMVRDNHSCFHLATTRLIVDQKSELQNLLRVPWTSS